MNLFKGQDAVTVVVLPGMQGAIGAVLQDSSGGEPVLQVSWELALWSGWQQSGVVEGAVLLVSPDQLIFVPTPVPFSELPLRPGRQEPS